MAEHLLREKAYRLIKQKIVSLEYELGSILMEHELCADLEIGRTPVREALQRLAAEKLVRIVPRRGIFVADINAWELDRLLEARVMLETHCIRKAAGLIRQEQIDALRDLFRDAPRLVAERKIPELLDTDRKFHMAIVTVLDNPFIAEMADKVYDQLARTWHLSFLRRSHEELMQAVGEHLAIVEALACRQAGAAEQAVMRHLENFRAKVAPRPRRPQMG